MLKKILLLLGITTLVFGSGFISYSYLKSTESKTATQTPPVETPKPASTPAGQPPVSDEESALTSNDIQLKNDLSAILAQLENHASNNRGHYPTTATEIANFNKNYIKDIVNSDSAQPYELNLKFSDGFSQVLYGTSSKCSANNLMAESDSPRHVALATNFSNDAAYCVSNT